MSLLLRACGTTDFRSGALCSLNRPTARRPRGSSRPTRRGASRASRRWRRGKGAPPASPAVVDRPRTLQTAKLPERPLPRKTAENEREDRDSNPGETFAPNGFQDRRLRPLGHPPGVSVPVLPPVLRDTGGGDADPERIAGTVPACLPMG